MALIRATLRGQLWGQECKNVLHFLRDNATQADMGHLATRLAEIWMTHLAFTQTQHWQWNRIDLQDLGENPMAPVTLSVNIGGQFFDALNMPGFMCFVYQLRTASSAGRRNRGRVYISGINVDLDQGIWTTSRVNFMASVLDAWVPEFVGNAPNSGWSWVLTSRTNPIGDIKSITSIVPRSYPGTQVRRNLFRGR